MDHLSAGMVLHFCVACYCQIALGLLSFSWFVNMIYDNDTIVHICLNIGSHNRLLPDVSNQEIDLELTYQYEAQQHI